MKNEEKIWQYLDGLADDATRQWVDEQCAQDAGFRLAFEERKKLHEGLKAMPLESPSMRFSRNVLDLLPATVVPLVTRKALRHFGIAACVVILGNLGIGLLAGASASPGAKSAWGSALAGAIQNLFLSLPESDLDLIAALGTGCFLLFLADRLFLKLSPRDHKKTSPGA